MKIMKKMSLMLASTMLLSSCLGMFASAADTQYVDLSKSTKCERVAHTHSSVCYDNEGRQCCLLHEHTHVSSCYLFPQTDENDTETSASKSVSDYTDVSSSAWYYDEVKYAVEKGFVDGLSDTTFSPTATMTRAQFILGLARMMGGSGTNTGKFTDVSASANYASAVYWGVENGIIQGSSDTTFSPNDRLTRQDMATMIGRMINKMNLNVPEVSNPAAVFTDMDKVRSYAKDSVDLLRRCGLLKGYSNGLVGPLDTMTRAEGTAIIVRMDKILNAQTDTSLDDSAENSDASNSESTVTPDTTVDSDAEHRHSYTYVSKVDATYDYSVPLVKTTPKKFA